MKDKSTVIAFGTMTWKRHDLIPITIVSDTFYKRLRLAIKCLFLNKVDGWVPYDWITKKGRQEMGV